ncbi:uncharacterized protein BXIN_2018 [Babesia sp. Xinjiang]|uniref:uncharacterized protein n=1 Tax=Babesia sp. Xinjiang TaxID=462227 RepID=UPI000A22CA0C|nr:uncharacterized protein BXIN_2018 [Babesia sp. Xinjiang]ORM40289.1 hypothetical protein BXIN_2018 [Babesia sp. Xinjiang]
MYNGRVVNIRTLYPELSAKSSMMSDSQLDDALGKYMSKNAYTVILRLCDILKDRFDFFTFRNVLKSKAGVAIILIPDQSDILPGSPDGCTESPMLDKDNVKAVCKNDKNGFHQSTLNAFHTYLLGWRSKAVVVVVEENEQSLKVMRTYGSDSPLFGSTDRYRISSISNKMIGGYKSINVFGTLKSAKDEADPEETTDGDDELSKDTDSNPQSKRTIVLCSHFDTFSLLQGYRTSGTNNSGLIALLELARLLEGVEHNEYDIVILMTSGAIINFQGAVAFANTYKKIDNVDLVICLDDLTGTDLYVHTSSKPTDVSHLFQNNIYRSVKEIFKNGVKAEAKVLFFQHEQFTRQKVHSITLTSVKDLIPFPLRQKSFEYGCNPSVLADHIVAIFRALTATLHCGRIKVDKSAIESHIREWDSMLANPRCGLTSDLSQLVSVRKIVKFLRPLVNDIETQKVSRMIAGFEVYSNAPVKLLFYRSCSTLYHVCILLASGLYIFVMWSMIRESPFAAWRDVTRAVHMTKARNTRDNSDHKSSERHQSKNKGS